MAIETWAKVKEEGLRSFCTRAFETLGVPRADAEITGDVLVSANLRGIDSHGVARLRRYVKGLQDRSMAATPEERVVHETGTTALIDGGGGLGQPVSVRAIKLAILKAEKLSTGFVAVRNSNHFGIAGYYAMMTLERNMIGISMTNSAVLVVPTFGRDSMLGTNPIAVAAPAGKERPFVLDMATSTVPRGKLEVYHRKEEPLPLGWATDETGIPTTDTGRVLGNLLSCRGGGLLPLGGAGELLSGHKGYGLALLVDILCGILPGAGYANNICPKTAEGKPLPANIGHFFGAIRIDAFRPLEQFKSAMDDIVRRLKNSSRAEGANRIYIHGEKEFEEADRRSKEGIPLEPKVEADLKAIAKELAIPYDL